MYTAIVFLPLIGCLIAGLFGRVIGARASEVVTTSLLGVAAFLSWIAFVQVAYGGHSTTVPLFTWMSVGTFEVSWSIRVDTLTAVMLVVVTTVSALVHLYSMGYMHEDPHRPRFFAYLSLFTFAMLMLVTADNLVQLFFGWEGVGLASYLLIGFWYQKASANAAAIKAFVVNRVGDFGFALGIFAIFMMTGSVEFDAIFAAAPSLVGKTVDLFGIAIDAPTLIALLLFMGAMGKSAQFLLHTWLPDAMEGPTPVSALIHAATMVTAGVFMVARLSPLFELSSFALSVVVFFGATTAIFAATVGLVQNDIKRIVAYSTCSQLGYMFVACGVGAYNIAVFHLFTHAFFKALLFLGAGSVIHAMHHEQDIRRMGGLAQKIPYTYAMMLVGTLALTGFGIPMLKLGFAGFFSKDAIIEAAFVSHNPVAAYGFMMTVIAAALTSFYSWRLVFLTFHGHAHDHHAADHAHEGPWTMTVPLGVLAVGAVFAGAVFYKNFVDYEYLEKFWRDSLYFGQAARDVLHHLHDVPIWVLWSPFVMMMSGFLVAYVFYIGSPGLADRLARRHDLAYRFLLNKWYFDELYDRFVVRPAMWLGRFFWRKGDGWLIDGFGPDGVAARVSDITGRVTKLQSGYVYHYAFAMLIGVAGFVTWFMFGGIG